jgi:hypothetical protein
VEAQDLELEPRTVIHEGLPPCPEKLSFLAVSLRDSTRGPDAATRDPEAWSTHRGHAAFLTGKQASDAPLLSHPDHIRALWPFDPSVATLNRYKSEVPGEPCSALSVTDSPHLGFWTAPKALVLPPNHNLPPGYVFDIKQATLYNFAL